MNCVRALSKATGFVSHRINHRNETESRCTKDCYIGHTALISTSVNSQIEKLPKYKKKLNATFAKSKIDDSYINSLIIEQKPRVKDQH